MRITKEEREISHNMSKISIKKIKGRAVVCGKCRESVTHESVYTYRFNYPGYGSVRRYKCMQCFKSVEALADWMRLDIVEDD